MPDGSGFIFLADDMESEEIEKERELGDDSYFVDLAPNGKHISPDTAISGQLTLRTRKSSKCPQCNSLPGTSTSHPDQSRVVFVARPDTRTNHPGDAEIYLLTLEDKSIARLTDNAAPEELCHVVA